MTRDLHFENVFQAQRRSPFTKSIREQAMLLVRAMLNEDGTLRVCASCEEESGPQKGNDHDKSHTYCKRHMLAMLNDLGATALIDKYAQEPEDRFAPDLVQHPELVDHGRAGAWRAEREVQQAAQRKQFQHAG